MGAKSSFFAIVRIYMNMLSTYENKIETAVRDVLKRELPANLFDPAIYMLSLGGKRLRPVFTLAAADLFGGNLDEVINAALAVEIFHNFSLLHDDLMDRSDMRRGFPTVHKKWNDNTAILSGDALVIESYKYIAKVPHKVLPEVLELFSTTAMEICKGQQYDMDFEERLDVTEDEYLEMIRLKTGVLLACALKLGALIAGASEKDADLLYDFGINTGLAFQLKDDLLDVYGNPETFGKKIGCDILCNKKTFLLIRCLQNVDDTQRGELLSWLTATDYDPLAKIDYVKNVYDELNLRSVVENKIENYYLASLDCLAAIDIPAERKNVLLAIAENLISREK